MSDRSISPSALPVELWVDILGRSQPNPVELVKLSLLDTLERPQDVFVKSLAWAARSNSLMKKFSLQDQAGTNRLDAFFERLNGKSNSVRRQLVHNYTSKVPSLAQLEGPVDDLDLAQSLVHTAGDRAGHAKPSSVARWLPTAGQHIKAHQELMKAAVALDGQMLAHTALALRKDKEVVLAAVTQAGDALEFASAELQNDKDVVLAAVAQLGEALEYASDELQNDKEVVLTALRSHGDVGCPLEWASSNLKDDRDVILVAMPYCGSLLEFLSAELQNDKEVVLAAARQDAASVVWASDELLNDKDFALSLLAL